MADNIDMIAALLVAAIIGAVAGWLAGQLFQGTGFGRLGDMIVGIFGALIASALLASLGLHGVVAFLPRSSRQPWAQLFFF